MDRYADSSRKISQNINALNIYTKHLEKKDEGRRCIIYSPTIMYSSGDVVIKCIIPTEITLNATMKCKRHLNYKHFVFEFGFGNLTKKPVVASWPNK